MVVTEYIVCGGCRRESRSLRGVDAAGGKRTGKLGRKRAVWPFLYLCLCFVYVCLLLLFLNSAISFGACTSAAGSHELSLAEYPFHLIRKYFLRPLPIIFLSRIFSTSYSGSPSIRSGGGRVKFGLCSSVSLYGVRRFA